MVSQPVLSRYSYCDCQLLVWGGISKAAVGLEGVCVIYHSHAGALPTMDNEIRRPQRTLSTSM